MKTTTGPQVSFVIPCYNYGRYLRDCLESIYSQEGDFEIIAVDDASTDDTQSVLHSLRDPRLTVITHQVNAGHVVTINRGLSEARGEFVARIDPDDRYRPCFLTTVLEKLRAHPEVGMAYGDVAQINEHGAITVPRSDSVHGGKDFHGRELIPLLKRNFICAPTVLARRETWLKALPIPAGMAFSDWYFTLMMARDHDFYYVDRVVADYRVHPLNHHSRIILDKTEETSILWLLDHIFSLPEQTREWEEQKQKAKAEIYGAQYLMLAEKYFWFNMNADARRCYRQAVRLEPAYLKRFDVMRHMAASIFGRGLYDSLKTAVKGLQRPSGNKTAQ